MVVKAFNQRKWIFESDPHGLSLKENVILWRGNFPWEESYSLCTWICKVLWINCVSFLSNWSPKCGSAGQVCFGTICRICGCMQPMENFHANLVSIVTGSELFKQAIIGWCWCKKPYPQMLAWFRPLMGHFPASFSSSLLVQQISIVSIQITQWLATPAKRVSARLEKICIVFYHTRAYPYEDSVQINKG